MWWLAQLATTLEDPGFDYQDLDAHLLFFLYLPYSEPHLMLSTVLSQYLIIAIITLKHH